MSEDPKNISEFMRTESPFMDAVEDAEEELAKGASRDEEDSEVEDSFEEEDDSEEEEDEGSEEEDEDGDEDPESEDEEEEDEEEEDDEDTKEAKSKDTTPKVYTATLPDGSQVKLTDDATVKIKVDGKFKRVPVRELASSYNGGVKHDELIRRTSETEKELKARISASEADANRAKELTKAFLEGVTKGDLIEALSIVGEMTGETDTSKILNDALSGIGKAIDDLARMTPEEVEKKARAHKLESELKKRERKLEELRRQEEVSAAVQAKEELKAKLGLEEEEMRQAYDALKSRNMALAKEGKQPPKFTLEDVAVLAVDYRHYNAIQSIAQKYELELESEDVNNLIDTAKIQARKLKRWPTKKEYVQLLSSYANKELNGINRKVGTKPTKTTPKSKKMAKKGEREVKAVSRLSQIWS